MRRSELARLACTSGATSRIQAAGVSTGSGTLISTADTISCGRPSSRTMKSNFVRPRTGLRSLSSTETSTSTSSMPLRNCGGWLAFGEVRQRRAPIAAKAGRFIAVRQDDTRKETGSRSSPYNLHLATSAFWRLQTMRPYRLIGLASVLAVTFAGQSLVGRTGQAPAGQAARGPFDSLRFRSIGPASMSGRISDLAVYEANPSIYYVGTAHGGVWKTVNAGTTFEAQFQNQGLIAIGDVTISQSNPDLVWVGTGESNNRQSTSWGDGVYKSTDGGKTYVNMGLKTSRHINRIVIDPRNNDVVFVAATGALFGPGGERGVFKTTDGGKTWKQVLKVDDDTGANDLVMDAQNNQIMYATTYQRRRTACCMNGGGP